jgi:hypothetical protein
MLMGPRPDSVNEGFGPARNQQHRQGVGWTGVGLGAAGKPRTPGRRGHVRKSQRTQFLGDRAGLAFTRWVTGFRCPDLLVEYLKERQPAMDYTSLEDASRTLVRNFWLQIERIQPGIDTLRLPYEVVSAWKQVSRTKVTRRRLPDGTVHEAVTERANYGSLMIGVRALYPDLAHWAVEEPKRWGLWVAPCPVSAADASTSKHQKRRKAKMDQRTRERLPALSSVVRAARANWTETREGMDALRAAPLGGQFTFRGRTYTRQKRDSSTQFRAYDESGRRVHLGLLEERAFWAWATIEFLQHTGVRIEEMLEASHHA